MTVKAILVPPHSIHLFHPRKTQATADSWVLNAFKILGVRDLASHHVKYWAMWNNSQVNLRRECKNSAVLALLQQKTIQLHFSIQVWINLSFHFAVKVFHLASVNAYFNTLWWIKSHRYTHVFLYLDFPHLLRAFKLPRQLHCIVHTQQSYFHGHICIILFFLLYWRANFSV